MVSSYPFRVQVELLLKKGPWRKVKILGIKQYIGSSQLCVQDVHHLENNFHLRVQMTHVIGAVWFLQEHVSHLVIYVELPDPGNLADVHPYEIGEVTPW